ncbi:uncharacterized protein LOC123378274 isoform X2 [Mauremys mutica]|uniref:uncharacterized protein LOC123378274 isoform X2 n=1 Tax=Mauremys mutica TaxID=74926 RepID=UPI001D1469EC|nr:uncharacterized protein LOC123378274 isoform X2 [Mauremys mutica]
MMQRNRDPVKKGEVRPYEFLELLVLCESKSKISDKVKKIRNTVATFREDFEENLRSLLADPDKQVAIYLKRNLQLRERWLFPRKSQKTVEPASFYREEQLKCRCYTQRISAPILSTEEIQAVEREKKDLQYQMLTLDARVMRNLKWKMDDYLPGYKKRVASVSIAAAPTPMRMTAPRTASRTDVFERLSTSGRRSPSPCHAAACNAFKQGLATKEGRGSSRVPNSSQARKMKGSKTKKHRETWVQSSKS